MILVSRQQWGSRNTIVPVNRDAMPEVFIHHVAGRWPTSVADEEAHMRELQTYAIQTKGYVDLDYSVLIGPSGRCYEGRGYFGKAAATLDRNATSRAVCLMGNLDTREPSQAQLDALPLLLADMVAKGSLMARVTVFGHFENPAHPGATACPGRYMKPHLPAVRSRLDALLHPTIPPVSEEDDMPPQLIRFRGTANELLFAYNTFTHGTEEQIAEWRTKYGDRGKAYVWEAHRQAMKGAFAKAGLDESDIARISE